MKNLNSENYVEVKDHRYRIQPHEKNLLGLQEEPKSPRTQNQVQNETPIRKNQNVVENNGKLEVKNYPKKKQPVIHQPKF